MQPHHKLAIQSITDKLKSKEDVLGIIIGGSVAHGYANEKSDIDIMLVVSDDKYTDLVKTGNINYYETESTPYECGYIDGKYTSTQYIKKVAKAGSEPARFAFKDSFVTYSKIPNLEQIIQAASMYPKEEKVIKLEKFYAQFEAWRWYYYEGLKRNNNYLINQSISNFVLYAGRLILAYNEALYPYHKWFLRELENVKNKPENLLLYINEVLEYKNELSVENLYNSIINFNKWSSSQKHWCIQFMLDSELNWLEGPVPVADL